MMWQPSASCMEGAEVYDVLLTATAVCAVCKRRQQFSVPAESLVGNIESGGRIEIQVTAIPDDWKYRRYELHCDVCMDKVAKGCDL